MEWNFELVAGPYKGGTEGPAWDGRTLFFTNFTLNRVMRYDPLTGETTEFATDTQMMNGLAFDSHGTLFGCAGSGHVLMRFDAEGNMTPLPNLLDGKRHNRPNDLAIDRMGRIWFSDPFGRTSSPEERQLDHTSVLRLDPTPDGSYDLKRMTFDTTSPNGVLLSQDERTLYVACGGYKTPVRELRAYPLQDDDTLGTYRTLFSIGRDAVSEEEAAIGRETRPEFIRDFGEEALGTHRGIDGMTLDVEGNIIACAGWNEKGPGPMVYVISPTGRILETHPFPTDFPTNCTFGDPDLGTLYLTGGEGMLYRVRNTGRRGWLNFPR